MQSDNQQTPPAPIFESLESFERYLLTGHYPDPPEGIGIAERAQQQRAVHILDDARKVYLHAYGSHAGGRWMEPTRAQVLAGGQTQLQRLAVHPNDAHSNAVGYAMNYLLRCGIDPCPIEKPKGEGGGNVLRLN